MEKPDITECQRCGRVIGTKVEHLRSVYAFEGQWFCNSCYHKRVGEKNPMKRQQRY